LNDMQSSPPPLPHSLYRQQQNEPELHPTRTLVRERIQHLTESIDSSVSSDLIPAHMELFRQKQRSHQKEILANFSESFALHRKRSTLANLKSPKKYEALVRKVLQESHGMVNARIPKEFLFFNKCIPGTRLDTTTKTRRFRQLVGQALNKGRWV